MKAYRRECNQKCGDFKIMGLEEMEGSAEYCRDPENNPKKSLWSSVIWVIFSCCELSSNFNLSHENCQWNKYVPVLLSKGLETNVWHIFKCRNFKICWKDKENPVTNFHVSSCFTKENVLFLIFLIGSIYCMCLSSKDYFLSIDIFKR